MSKKGGFISVSRIARCDMIMSDAFCQYRKEISSRFCRGFISPVKDYLFYILSVVFLLLFALWKSQTFAVATCYLIVFVWANSVKEWGFQTVIVPLRDQRSSKKQFYDIEFLYAPVVIPCLLIQNCRIDNLKTISCCKLCVIVLINIFIIS